MRRRTYLSTFSAGITAGLAGCGGLAGADDPENPGAEPPEIGSPSDVQNNETSTVAANSSDLVEFNDSTWPMYQRDSANTGFTPAAPATEGEELWTYEAEEGFVSGSIVIADDAIVYPIAPPSHIIALNRADGTERWIYEANEDLVRPPAIRGETAYVVGTRLHALDMADGSRIWDLDIFSPEEEGLYSAPTVTGDRLYVGTPQGVHAVDLQEQRELWWFETDDVVQSAPAVYNDTVFFGSLDEHVYAVDADEGAEKWRYNADNMVPAAPAVADGTVFANTIGGTLYALDAADGGENWSHDHQNYNALEKAPAVKDGNVFLGGMAGYLSAVDADDGTVVWTEEIGPPFEAAPVIASDHVYVTTNDGIHAHDIRDGSEHWHFAIDAFMHGAPAVADGTLYTSTKEGTVYALE